MVPERPATLIADVTVLLLLVLMVTSASLVNEVLALEDRFDTEVGPGVRRIVYDRLTRTRGATAKAFFHLYPASVHRRWWPLFPVFDVLIPRSMGLTPENVAAGERARDAAFALIAERTGGDPDRMLVGDTLTLADITAATLLGPLAAHLLTGSLVVESVFNLPGAGAFFVHSIQNRDGFLLGGVVIVYCVLLVGFNLLVDLAYTLLDRRIRLDG